MNNSYSALPAENTGNKHLPPLFTIFLTSYLKFCSLICLGWWVLIPNVLSEIKMSTFVGGISACIIYLSSSQLKSPVYRTLTPSTSITNMAAPTIWPATYGVILIPYYYISTPNLTSHIRVNDYVTCYCENKTLSSFLTLRVSFTK